MAIKFEKIQPGMTLWSRAKLRQGNVTGLRVTSEWQVYVYEVDSARRRALVSWNTNAREWWSEARLKRLFSTKIKRQP